MERLSSRSPRWFDMIAIIDYGMGNLGSIHNMLARIEADSIVTFDPSQIRKAQKLILPGVGAFDHAMKNLKDLNLIGILNEKVLELKTPILGICLGMQIMTKDSQEGDLPGLGWIDAYTKKFDFTFLDPPLKIPHMGWNTLETKRSVMFLAKLPQNPRFYFVHSYHVVCSNAEDVVATADYGGDFVAAFAQDNIYAVQFHPEKSHQFGMQVLKNFAQSPC